MSLTRFNWILASFIAASATSALSAQHPRWQLTTEVRAGYFIPTRDLGTTGVTTGRMRSAPTLGASLRVKRSGLPAAVFVATTQALSGDLDVRPTSDCLSRCEPTTVRHGRFWTLTAGASVAWRLGPAEVSAQVGGGYRVYALLGKNLIQRLPPPGEMWAHSFSHSMVDPSMHLALQIARSAGEHEVFIGLEDFLGKNGHRRTLHDLVLSAGLHMRWPSKGR